MKTTRNLFLLSGERETVKYVLDKLSFKGLVTAPLGTMVDNNYLDRAFGRNKSAVCYARDYVMDYDIQRTVQGRRIHRIIVSKTYHPIKQFIFVGSEEPVEKQFARVGDILHMEKGKIPFATAIAPKEGYLPYVDIKAFEKGIVDRYASVQNAVLCNNGDLLIVCDGSRSGLTGKAIKGVVGSTL